MIFQPCAERALVTEFANQRRVTRIVLLTSADVAATHH